MKKSIIGFSLFICASFFASSLIAQNEAKVLWLVSQTGGPEAEDFALLKSASKSELLRKLQNKRKALVVKAIKEDNTTKLETLDGKVLPAPGDEDPTANYIFTASPMIEIKSPDGFKILMVNDMGDLNNLKVSYLQYLVREVYQIKAIPLGDGNTIDGATIAMVEYLQISARRQEIEAEKALLIKQRADAGAVKVDPFEDRIQKLIHEDFAEEFKLRSQIAKYAKPVFFSSLEALRLILENYEYLGFSAEEARDLAFSYKQLLNTVNAKFLEFRNRAREVIAYATLAKDQEKLKAETENDLNARKQIDISETLILQNRKWLKTFCEKHPDLKAAWMDML